MDKTAPPKVLLCDLDGVVWLAHRPVPGSVDALVAAARAGVEILYVTNNSFSTVAEQEAHLAAIGLDAVGRVVTSAMSAASVLAPDARVLVCGGAGLREEVSRAGCEMVVAHENPGRVDDYSDVVVGLYAPCARGRGSWGATPTIRTRRPRVSCPAAVRCWPRSPRRRPPRLWSRESRTSRWCASCVPVFPVLSRAIS
jgi:ribonucleotide monophosphatase NagD (HAD superfamily)